MAAGRATAFIASLRDAATLTAEAEVCYDAIITPCSMAAASVRRGVYILDNQLAHIGGAVPEGFQAEARGVYANVEAFYVCSDAPSFQESECVCGNM